MLWNTYSENPAVKEKTGIWLMDQNHVKVSPQDLEKLGNERQREATQE